MVRTTSDSLEQTNSLALRLAPALRAGDAVLLHGPVGAGKTAFARAVIDLRLRAIGKSEEIPSPSFSLIQTYDLSDCDLLHVDLYRLNSMDELDELGLEYAFDTAITLVEWPEKLGIYTPKNALHIHIDIARDDTRRLRFAADGARAQSLIDGLHP